jgi:hypothetical protein
MTEPLTTTTADELLDGIPVVPAMAGSIAEMKALRARCLAAGIPATVGCPPGAAGGG